MSMKTKHEKEVCPICRKRETQSVYEQLCGMFSKKDVDYAIKEAERGLTFPRPDSDD